MPAPNPRRIITALTSAVAACLLFAPGAAAQVQNPGGFTANVTGGNLTIGGTVVDLGTATSPSSLTGTVDGDGTLSIPTSGIIFGPVVVSEGLPFPVTVLIQPATSAWSGSIDPATGAVSMTGTFRVKLEDAAAILGATCFLGPAGGIPLDPLSTGGGTPYNPADGTATVSNGAFSVPGASGCGAPIDPVINATLGLPSAAGANSMTLALAFDPILLEATGPTTTIVSGPSGVVDSPDAVFEFTSGNPAASFECSLDGAPFEPCSSPQSYSGLTNGEHTFQVRATDPEGNVGPPATRTWTVEVSGPTPGDGPCGGSLIEGTEGDDLLIGNLLADRILGLGGDDRLAGRGADDCLNGGTGDDRLAGGAGVDEMFGGPGDDTMLGKTGEDWMFGHEGDDVIEGNRGPDRIAGKEGADQIAGNKGSDSIAGNEGPDEISGNAGNDRIRVAGGGPDVVRCGPGNDRATIDETDTVKACEQVKLKAR